MQSFDIPRGASVCPCPERRPVWGTDALRVHEQFHDLGPNLEAFSLVMQVWERLLLIHVLRGFERRGWLEWLTRVAFFVDGPLAVFSTPAWLSKPIGRELRRIDALVRAASGGRGLLLVGVEKSGAFVTHFDDVDHTEDGSPRFPPGTYFMPTDAYIKERIQFSDSKKSYGQDTYFGRKFFYKTRSGARLVASIPFLDNTPDGLYVSDANAYPSFGPTCALLDRLVTSRFPNALSPLVTAHAQAAIPLQLGGKVLQQLARALMQTTP